LIGPGRTRRRQVLQLVADAAGRPIRESTKQLGRPIMVFIGGDLDLLCGRCEALLVRGIDDAVRLGDVLLKCPSCDALNAARRIKS